MAETKMKAGGVVCDEKCGCPSPCPGGTACKCTGRGGEAAESEHKTCGGCGQHCGCNPCSCRKSVSVTGKASCKCGSACTCTSCASSKD
ncbi:hypothetical protein V2J09_016721 [Rumex salicifolius]